MELQDYLRVLRARWLMVVLVTVAGALGGLATSLTSTPQYASTAKLFVATNVSGTSANEVYQGGRFSQERVSSYVELITGSQVAQAAIEELGLDISPGDLSSRVTASTKLNTVIIGITVTDSDPGMASDLANAVAGGFTRLVAELETPAPVVNEDTGEAEEAAPATRVTVVEPAAPSSAPVSPDPVRDTVLGIMLGLALGVGLAFLLEVLDNTVRRPADVEALSGAVVLGTIPFERERATTARIDFSDPHSLGAEAFRTLRTNLQFLDIDNPPKSIVITSPVAGEGKTTTAINLAAALAESGTRVVLVEADLRRPRATAALGLVGGVGLTTVLAGNAQLDDVLQPTDNPGLFVLGAGALPPNPSELLSSAQAKALFKDLADRADYVIFDAPPLLPVTDAAVLASAADATVVVARHGRTKRNHLANAVKALRKVGVTSHGAVLSMVPAGELESYASSYS